MSNCVYCEHFKGFDEYCKQENYATKEETSVKCLDYKKTKTILIPKKLLEDINDFIYSVEGTSVGGETSSDLLLQIDEVIDNE